MEPKIYPFCTLDSFRECTIELEKIETESQLKYWLGIPEHKKLTLTKINRITDRVINFPDYTYPNVKEFTHRVQRFIPKERLRPKERMDIETLLQMTRVPPKPKNPLLQLVPPPPSISGAQFEEMLTEVEESFNLPPDARLEQYLTKVCAKTPEEKLQAYQRILTYLQLEEKFFHAHIYETETSLITFDLEKHAYEKTSGVLHLNRIDSVVLCKVQADESCEEEWAYRLQYEQYVTRAKWTNYLVNVKSNLAVAKKIGQCEQLMQKVYAQTENANLKDTIETHLRFMRYESMYYVMIHSTRNLWELFHQFSASKDISLDKYTAHTKLITPYYSVLMTLMGIEIKRQQYNKMIDEGTNIDPSVYQLHQRLDGFWAKRRADQRAFFRVALDRMGSSLKVAPYKRSLFHKPQEQGECFDIKIYDQPLPNLEAYLNLCFDRNASEVKEPAEQPKSVPSTPVPQAQPTGRKHRRSRPHYRPQQPVQQAIQAPPPPVMTQPKAPLFNPIKHARVLRWHRHPLGEQLTGKPFPEYEHVPIREHLRIHLFHLLSPTVNDFMDYAIKTTWKNRTSNRDDVLYVIPAEMTIGKDKYRGMITRCVDSKGVLYHDCMQLMKDNDILTRVVEKRFIEDDFPELSKVKLAATEAVETYQQPKLNETITIHPLFGTVTITTVHHFQNETIPVTLKLFKTDPETEKA
jgi:hypothetical protein